MLFLQTIIRMKDNWKYSKYWSVVCWKLCPSSHCLGLLGNRTIRHRNIDMDQCKLKYCAVVCWVLCPSHRHLLNIFHFFYLKCTSVRNNYRWINLFIISHHLYKITSLLGHFQYCRPLWIMTFTCTDSSNN